MYFWPKITIFESSWGYQIYYSQKFDIKGQKGVKYGVNEGQISFCLIYTQMCQFPCVFA